MAYPLPLDTAYRLSGTEAEILCMTRSSMNKLFTPYKEPEREFRSSRRHFKTLRSGVVRPKIEEKDSFELKGQFLKELRENTFSGSDNEDANEHIEKVLEIVYLFHVPNITVDQLMLRVFPVIQTIAMQFVAKKQTNSSSNLLQRDTKKFQFDQRKSELRQMLQKNQGASIKTFRDTNHANEQGTYRKEIWSLPSSTKTNPRDQVKSISTTIEADSYLIRRIGSPQYAVSTGQNSKLVYKSRQTTVPFPSHLDNHYCEEEEEEGIYGPKFTEAYGASHINHTIPRKEKDPGSFTLPCFINNVCFDNALVDLGASVSVMPLLTYLNLGLGELAHTRLTVELADRTVKYPKGIAENVLVGIGKFTFPIDFIILDMPEDIKVPLILGRPFLSTARSKIDVYKRKITLRVIEEFRTRDEDLDTGIDDYPSYCDEDKKIHIDCAHNLRFSCMIGFKFTHANLFPLLYVNVIMKDKMVYKGNNVVGAVMNVPIFVGTFSVVIDFAVLENMDAYRDEGMGDVIVGEPFLREIGIKAKQFKGIITLYKNDDEATYQMV
ncbi:reverse transcriptase domain-containing protein [Tanacetum coccineum]